ncbi:hypothetical protein [Bordetella sp. 02P26C-1]|uniref:hypothetical protein n=1 Tax=Bordetella sp. 02P26C-1 TaxID=2683195 RepID=UPI001355B0C7|nr:hypothetical protein [Bordetella sp. 02P26C-1]MVW77735.1 hypothetical protein [Bordetella sp. 02P26C-1]
MMLYRLATVAGVGFMLAGGGVLVAYLYQAIYLATPANAPDLSWAFTLYLLGHILIVVRSHLINDLAHRIRHHGESGDARILTAKRIGSPEEGRDRHWYALTLRVQPHRANTSDFDTSVTQLFSAQASARLAPGSILPVKFGDKPAQVVVTGEGAFPAIRR